MENYTNILPLKQIVIYLLLGALLHFVFYVVSKYIIPVLLKKESAFALLWQRLQVVVWGLFFTLFLSSLLVANMILTVVIGFVILVIGWGFLTNLFAGISIKFTNTPKTHDFIVTDLVVGKIKSINLTYTEVINNKGELITIPNSKLNKLVIKHINDAKSLNPFTYTYIPKKEISYDTLYQQVLNCPYFTGNQIMKIERGTDNKSFLIKAMLLDENLKEKAIAYFQ